MPPNFQYDVKTKILAVREVVRNVSSEDIGLVLQHFDYNVQQAVATFLDGGACSIIDQWKKTTVKQNRAKRSKKSRDADNARVACSQDLSQSTGSEEKVGLSSYEARHWDQCSTEDSTTLSADSASDSRSVASDSAATVSSSSDQAVDSGYETTIVPINVHETLNEHIVLNGHTTKNGHATVNGHTTVNRHAPVKGHVPVNGHVPVKGHAPVKGHVPVNGYAPVNGHVPVNGHASVNGHALVTGHTPVNEHPILIGHTIVNTSHLTCNVEKKKNVGAPTSNVHASTTALLVETSFNQLRARLDRRQADLLLQIDNERMRSGAEPVYICNLTDLFQVIERFGTLQTKSPEEKSSKITSDVTREDATSSHDNLSAQRHDRTSEGSTQEKYVHEVNEDDDEVSEDDDDDDHVDETTKSTKEGDRDNLERTNSCPPVKVLKGRKKSLNKKSRNKNRRNTSINVASPGIATCDILTTTPVVSKKKSSKVLVTDQSSNDQMLHEASVLPLPKDIVFGVYVSNQSDSLTQYEKLHLQSTQVLTSGAIKPKDLKKILLGTVE